MSSSLGISLSLPPYQMNRHSRPLIFLIFSSNAPRNKDLTEMNIAIEFRIDQLQANGTYNVRRVRISLHGKRVSIKVTGWLGFEWIPLESQGQQPFTAALINGTLSPQVLIICFLEAVEAFSKSSFELVQALPLIYSIKSFHYHAAPIYK